MSRYTLAELNRTALDAVTLSTPAAVLEGVEYRVSMILDAAYAPSELAEAVLSAIADAHADLDRIESEASR